MLELLRLGPGVLTAFGASLVEFVEALPIVLAVGTTRGWRSALAGTAVALVGLGALVMVLGPALQQVPVAPLQLVIGTLTLLLGTRWLLKAVRRAAGVLAQRDEAGIYARTTAALQVDTTAPPRLDREGMVMAFQGVAIEGLEVVFIVLAVGSTGTGLAVAALGAGAALLLVLSLGLLLRRPLARIPENALKLGVAITLCALGSNWVGEGMGLQWPAHEWAVLWLVAYFALLAAAGMALACRQPPATAARVSTPGSAPTRGLRKALGLFVDDWASAGAVIACVALAWLAILTLPGAPGAHAALLLGGLAAVLLIALWGRGRSGGSQPAQHGGRLGRRDLD